MKQQRCKTGSRRCFNGDCLVKGAIKRTKRCEFGTKKCYDEICRPSDRKRKATRSSDRKRKATHTSQSNKTRRKKQPIGKSKETPEVENMKLIKQMTTDQWEKSFEDRINEYELKMSEDSLEKFAQSSIAKKYYDSESVDVDELKKDIDALLSDYGEHLEIAKAFFTQYPIWFPTRQPMAFDDIKLGNSYMMRVEELTYFECEAININKDDDGFIKLANMKITRILQSDLLPEIIKKGAVFKLQQNYTDDIDDYEYGNTYIKFDGDEWMEPNDMFEIK